MKTTYIPEYIPGNFAFVTPSGNFTVVFLPLSSPVSPASVTPDIHLDGRHSAASLPQIAGSRLTEAMPM